MSDVTLRAKLGPIKGKPAREKGEDPVVQIILEVDEYTSDLLRLFGRIGRSFDVTFEDGQIEMFPNGTAPADQASFDDLPIQDATPAPANGDSTDVVVYEARESSVARVLPVRYPERSE